MLVVVLHGQVHNYSRVHTRVAGKFRVDVRAYQGLLELGFWEIDGSGQPKLEKG